MKFIEVLKSSKSYGVPAAKFSVSGSHFEICLRLIDRLAAVDKDIDRANRKVYYATIWPKPFDSILRERKLTTPVVMATTAEMNNER